MRLWSERAVCFKIHKGHLPPPLRLPQQLQGQQRPSSHSKAVLSVKEMQSVRRDDCACALGLGRFRLDELRGLPDRDAGLDAGQIPATGLEGGGAVGAAAEDAQAGLACGHKA